MKLSSITGRHLSFALKESREKKLMMTQIKVSIHLSNVVFVKLKLNKHQKKKKKKKKKRKRNCSRIPVDNRMQKNTMKN